MSRLRANQITNKTANGAPTATNGLIVTGVCTATSFVGSGTALTGIDAATLKFGGATKAQAVSGGVNITGDVSVSGALGVAGVLTYEDVTNVDSIGVGTFRDGLRVTGICTATAFHGDGSALTGTGVGGSTSINTTGIGTFSAVVSDTATSHRNMIINGAMLVAQRQDKTGVTDHYGGCDRFKFLRDGATAVTLRQAGGADSIPGEGFSKSQHIDVTSEDSSMGAANYNILTTRLEGQDLQRIKKGTPNAEQITVSFYIKSTITGTYILELTDNDNSRSCSKAYTINQSNTWEKKVITFPADTTGQYDCDASLSMEVNWWLGAGSNYASGTLQTTWGTQTNANRAVGCVNAVSSTSNNIYLTGVQMEIGPVATPFEHRTFTAEIQRCMRYYEKSFQYTDAPANNGSYSTTGGGGAVFSRSHNGSNRGKIQFKVEKRSGPSLTFYGNSSGYWHSPSSGFHQYNSTSNGPDRTGFYPRQQASGSVIDVQGHYAADAEL